MLPSEKTMMKIIFNDVDSVLNYGRVSSNVLGVWLFGYIKNYVIMFLPLLLAYFITLLRITLYI